jgi:hypothetical protein
VKREMAVVAACSGQNTRPPIAEIDLTHRCIPFTPMRLDGGRALCACKIPPAFPYTGLRAGMFAAEISPGQLSGYSATQVVPILA